ncbi:hypothetical protein HO133_005948 [Letharia lupina]|uniref:FAD-binding domain-containing protein n=1 Tax=Letharia lupina TaxID=560253 RepID=A0A8H6C7W8_9LECA|nr:uncharacterized protein HO133_005948 [Letharia lupina]KAF6218597.1 hypothetical protein HO133_005948 [Letharia lupina]
MEETKLRPFKVVIVGAGLSGLLLAHLLTQASIDFVILEAHKNVVHPAGGSFGCWPNAARILDQAGIWESVEKSGAPMGLNYIRKPNGSAFITSSLSSKIASVYGYDFRILERYRYHQILYENLPDKSKLWTGKRVTDIIEDCNGVRVVFENGSCQGDIVAGCDGVHSVVRQIMWEKANKLSPGLISAREKRSLTSSYRCLVGAAPAIAGIGANESNMIQNQGVYMVIVSQPGQTLFFVCIKEANVSHWPQRSHFTKEDAEKEAAKIADRPVTAHVLFGEIWMKRTRGYLTSLEDGVFEHWFFNRIVLVGDSAHKMSPIGAHGGNCAIESVAALANSLDRHLRLCSDTSANSKTIQSIFETYQRTREARVRKFAGSVHLMTRLVTWDGYTKKFVARYVLPWLNEVTFVGKLIKDAVKVDFLPIPSRSKGFFDQTSDEGKR